MTQINASQSWTESFDSHTQDQNFYEAIWHASDADYPIIVIGDFGTGSDGCRYLRYKEQVDEYTWIEAAGGVPADQIERLANGASRGAFRRQGEHHAAPDPATDQAAHRLMAAREYCAAGLSPIPIGKQSKSPPAGFGWRAFQRRRPTDDELRAWVSRFPGLGVVCGKVSGHRSADGEAVDALEVLDLESIAPLNEFRQHVDEAAPGLFDRLPRPKTPTDGRHIYYRCEIVEGNQKLAQRAEEIADADLPRTDDGALDKKAIQKIGLREKGGRYFKIRTLIETRGEGGQVLSPLCLPGTHPSGGVYELINGDLRDIPTITAVEREILLNAARACNEFIEPAKAKGTREAEREKIEGLKPGADYNARSDAFEKSRALLEEYGWTLFRPDSLGELWSRPGVTDHCSARLFSDGALYVFSTNASPFDAGETYSPFAIYTELKHGTGNYSAAAMERRNNEMSDLSNVIANGFINTYRDFGKRVHDLSEELSEQEFWTKPYPYGNSVGHLALHIIGNLNYYIGARIAQTGYARDRDREFNESDPPPKKEVLRQLDEVVELVVKTLEAQTSDSWGTEYSAVGWEALNDRFTAFHRCAAHFQYHTGHMIYLVYEHRRLKTNQSRSQ